MTTLLRTTFLIGLHTVLLASITAGCGTVDDPTQHNNRSDNNHVNDTGQKDANRQDTDRQDTDSTPSNPYDKLGLPYELEPLPPGTTAPWPGTISHGALINIAHVIDGDTVRTDLAEQNNIRLLGVDAPECAKRNFGNGMECDPSNTEYTTEAKAQFPNEPYGAQAGQALKDLIALNPEVRIACKMSGRQCERDMYDRFLAFVVVDTPDGPVDASYYIIEQGLGWTYTSFPTENMAMYCKAEDEAIAEKRGMWKNGAAAALAAVTPETRQWYGNRNGKCRELQR